LVNRLAKGLLGRKEGVFPMQINLTFRSGRGAVASLELAGGLLVGTACTPAKKSSPPSPTAAPPAVGLSISPTSFDWGEIETGGGTDPFTFTVTNDGQVDSGELGVTLDQPAPAQFKFGARIPGVDDSCSGEVLASGEECTVGVEFSPTSDGLHEATLLVTADPGGTASSALSGTGGTH
jgi:hypothetical protein